MRRDAIRNARVSPGVVKCEECNKRMKENVKPKPYEVDHIVPASEPSAKIKSWDNFFTRLFVPASGLRVLCKPCHGSKTRSENEVRRRPKFKKANSRLPITRK